VFSSGVIDFLNNAPGQWTCPVVVMFQSF
jgi:hypothetical protein